MVRKSNFTDAARGSLERARWECLGDMAVTRWAAEAGAVSLWLACARVAAEENVDGPSFEAVVKRIWRSATRAAANPSN